MVFTNAPLTSITGAVGAGLSSDELVRANGDMTAAFADASSRAPNYVVNAAGSMAVP